MLSDAPEAVREQIQRFVDQTVVILPGAVSGIYLHGSLAMGCFNAAHSDIDLLVILTRALHPEEHPSLAAMLPQLSNQPCPLEVSFLTQEQLRPWRTPTPFAFHYSESWRQAMTEAVQGEASHPWVSGEPADPDLAAHITVTQARGIVLYGAPIADMFPAVPPADYLASIRADSDVPLDEIEANPVYFVLNLCRVWGYVETGRVLSKAEGATWALDTLPAQYHGIISAALDAYQQQGTFEVDHAALGRFVEDAQARIKRQD